MSSVVTTHPARHAHRAQRVADAVVSAYIREITPTERRSARPQPAGWGVGRVGGVGRAGGVRRGGGVGRGRVVPGRHRPLGGRSRGKSGAQSEEDVDEEDVEDDDDDDESELLEEEPEEPESDDELLELDEDSFGLLGPSAESFISRARLRVP